MELMVACYENQGHCEHEMSIFTPPPDDAGLYFSKKPTDIRHIKKVFLKDPELYVICMFRDPRAVISSIHKSKEGMYFCNYREWKGCQDAAEALVHHERFHLIQYERLTENPNAVQAEIQTKFPFLKRRHDFTDYTEVAKPSEKSQNALSGVRPISADRQKNWQQHLPRVKEQLERYPSMQEDLLRLNYESDHTWTECLKQIKSQRFPCRYSDRGFQPKKIESKIRQYFKSKAYIRRKGL